MIFEQSQYVFVLIYRIAVIVVIDMGIKFVNWSLRYYLNIWNAVRGKQGTFLVVVNFVQFLFVLDEGLLYNLVRVCRRYWKELKIMLKWSSETYWSGSDMKEFNLQREQLEQKQIPYKYKVRNRLGQWGGTRGTIRGNTGSAGIPAEEMYVYDIIIDRKDMERAGKLKE